MDHETNNRCFYDGGYMLKLLKHIPGWILLGSLNARIDPNSSHRNVESRDQ